MMSSTLVLVEQRDHVAQIILNRPDKRNAIDWPTLQALDSAITDAEKRPGVRVILVRGQGKAFSAGIDLTAFFSMSDQFGDNWRHDSLPLTRAFQTIVNKFESSSIPTIALLHGYCLGLGMELALACDMRIVAEGTRLALPETKLGIIPDVGGTTRLTRLIGPARAKEFIMTGKDIPLDAAQRWGIVNYVVPAEELEAKGHILADEIASSAPLAVTFSKHVIDGLFDLKRGLELEAFAQSRLFPTEDFMTGAQAMISKQPPEWEGK